MRDLPGRGQGTQNGKRARLPLLPRLELPLSCYLIEISNQITPSTDFTSYLRRASMSPG